MAQKQLEQPSVTKQLNKVFFDLDGTLIDVASRHYRVYSELTQQFGGTPLEKNTYWDMKRKKTKWPQLLPASGLSPRIEREFLEAFIPRIEDPEYLKIDQLYPDALSTVKTLTERFECYLVSLRRNQTNLLAELGWLGLQPHFVRILSGHSESDGYDKKIELISAELGDAGGVIIGDTEADIITGKELGLTTIAVTSGIRDEQFLQALEPDYVIEHIGQALTLPIFKEA
jgi:phosphoglycolate phosphatase